MARRCAFLLMTSLLFCCTASAHGPAGAPGLAAATSATARDAAPVSLLVFPFENTGQNPRVDWVGEAVADLAAERLQGEGRLLRSRAELAAAVERMGLPNAAGGASRFSRATMLKLAEQLDADWLLFGEFRTDGRILTLSARLLRVYPAALSAPMNETGSLADLSELHARLMWQVARQLDRAYPFSRDEFTQRVARLRADAIENFARGQSAADDAERLRLWREAARLEPQWPAPAFALGTAYLAAGDCANAVAWFGRIPLELAHGREAAFYSAGCAIERKDVARADQLLSALAESRPGGGLAAQPEPEALNNLALVRARRGLWSDAVTLLQRAAQRDPADADYWFNLGLVNLRAGDAGAAVRPLREAARRAPGDASAHSLLVHALESAGRQPEAESARNAAPEAVAQVTAATLGGLERMKARLETGVAAPGNGGEASPRRAETVRRYLARGQEALTAARWEEAERRFAAAVLLAPDSAEAHAGLAEAYFAQQRADDAVREWRAALFGRDSADLRLRLAQALLQMTPPRRADARTELRAALRLNPPPQVREEVRRLLDTVDAESGARP